MRQLFQRLDPRARVASIVLITIIVTSTPRGVLAPFAAYFPLAILVALTARVSGYYLAWRCLAASPFILAAAGLLAWQAGPEAAASVALKAYTAGLLLAFLTSSTTTEELLTAMRRLGSPNSLNVILAMMLRYTSLLSREYARMERARSCRTVRPLGWAERYRVTGRQLGTLVLRSWDQAERVHAAMLSRGFQGVWPAGKTTTMGAADWAFLAGSATMFLAARFALAPFA